MAPERRAVFFDRDGTLMEETDYCKDPSQVHAFPGAAEGLQELQREGWLNILITNQSGIGRGYFTETEYELVNAELFRQLGYGITAAYFCPDHPDVSTPRRKPGIGMVEEAVRDHGVNPRASWFIGDKDADIKCGQAAGCRTILVRTGYGINHIGCGEEFVADNVAAAIKIVLHHSSPASQS